MIEESEEVSTLFMIRWQEAEGGGRSEERKDKKFKPHATLIALHATDCKWQRRGCHLLLAASFNLMSSKMEFHFIVGSDHIRWGSPG